MLKALKLSMDFVSVSQLVLNKIKFLSMGTARADQDFSTTVLVFAFLIVKLIKF